MRTISFLVRPLLAALALAMVMPGLAAAADAAKSPAEICPLTIGSAVPAVTLKTLRGEPFDLAAAVREKPTILIFYRGGW